MLNIDTLSVNKRVFNPNPEERADLFGVWDLTQSSINYDIANMNSRKLYRVSSDLVMRPDLISLYNTGDPQYCGSLMKVNGISNPFAIDEGRILIILSPEVIRRTYERKKQELSGNTSSSSSSPALDNLKRAQEDKIFKVSEGRKNFLEKTIKNKPAVVLPPNVSQPGDRKFTRKGQVFTFAPDAGKGGFNRPTKK